MKTMSMEPRFRRNLWQVAQYRFTCHAIRARTDWMGPLGTHVYTEEWNSYKGTIPP